MKLALALLLANTLNLSFEYRESNPYSLFPYNYAVSDTNPLGHLSNPAFLPLWEPAYVSIDYVKPYLMDELNSGNLRVGYNFNNAAFQIAWNRFGIKEYSEDVLEGNFGYRPWKFLSAGLGISYFHININTEDIKFKYGTTDFKFSMLLLPYEWINIGYMQENIYSIFDRNIKKKKQENNTIDLIYPNQSFGATLKPANGIWFAWNINRTYYSYINSFSVTANMLSCLSLKGGYSRETLSYSFSVNFIYKKFLVSYGLSHHTYLGSTHKLGLTVATCDLLFEELNYNKSLIRHSLPEKKKKINVNDCSFEELIESKLFSQEIAERIIKYRDTIGPISEKGLIQIGISRQELEKIQEYISGLADETIVNNETEPTKTGAKIYKARLKTGYDVDTRKLLFQKLLENGINAGTALKISDQAKSSSKDGLIRKIKESADIDEEKKKIIIKTCIDFL
jgi:hypothetical protein